MISMESAETHGWLPGIFVGGMRLYISKFCDNMEWSVFKHMDYGSKAYSYPVEEVSSLETESSPDSWKPDLRTLHTDFFITLVKF